MERTKECRPSFSRNEEYFTRHIFSEMMTDGEYRPLLERVGHSPVLVLADRMLTAMSSCGLNEYNSAYMNIQQSLLKPTFATEGVADKLIEECPSALEGWANFLLLITGKMSVSKSYPYLWARLVDLGVLNEEESKTSIDLTRKTYHDAIVKLSISKTRKQIVLAKEIRNPQIHIRKIHESFRNNYSGIYWTYLLALVLKKYDSLFETMRKFVFRDPLDKHERIASPYKEMLSEREEHLRKFRGPKEWLKKIHSVLELPAEGKGRVIFLKGNEGVGKSALITVLAGSRGNTTKGSKKSLLDRHLDTFPWDPACLMILGKSTKTIATTRECLLAQIDALSLEEEDASRALRISIPLGEGHQISVPLIGEIWRHLQSYLPGSRMQSDSAGSYPDRCSMTDIVKERLVALVKERGAVTVLIDGLNDIRSSPTLNEIFDVADLPSGCTVLATVRTGNRPLRKYTGKKIELPPLGNLTTEDIREILNIPDAELAKIEQQTMGWAFVIDIYAEQLRNHRAIALDFDPAKLLQPKLDSLCEYWKKAEMTPLLNILSLCERVGPLKIRWVEKFMKWATGGEIWDSRAIWTEMLEGVKEQLTDARADEFQLMQPLLANYVTENTLNETEKSGLLRQLTDWMRAHIDTDEELRRFMVDFVATWLEESASYDMPPFKSLLDALVTKKEASLLWNIQEEYRNQAGPRKDNIIYRLITMAADAGHSQALYHVGILQITKDSNFSEVEAGWEKIHQAAAGGCRDAMAFSGWKKVLRAGNQEEFDRALEMLETTKSFGNEIADGFYASALTMEPKRVLDGYRLLKALNEQDNEAARIVIEIQEFFQSNSAISIPDFDALASKHGLEEHPYFLYQKGTLLFLGLGGQHDQKTGYELLKKSMEAGCVDARVLLALFRIEQSILVPDFTDRSLLDEVTSGMVRETTILPYGEYLAQYYDPASDYRRTLDRFERILGIDLAEKARLQWKGERYFACQTTLGNKKILIDVALIKAQNLRFAVEGYRVLLENIDLCRPILVARLRELVSPAEIYFQGLKSDACWILHKLIENGFGDSQTRINLAFMIRRGEADGVAGRYDILELLAPGLDEDNPFALINMALYLIDARLGREGVDSAERLLDLIQEPENLWKGCWSQLEKKNDPEGDLVLGLLMRNCGLPPQDSRGFRDHLLEARKAGRYFIPDRLLEPKP